MFGTTTRRLSQLCLDGLVANADVIGHFHLRRVISEAGSWLDPVTIRLSGPCQPRNVATCLRRVQSGAGKAHKTPQPRRRALYRNRPHSAELRADEGRSRRGMASELRTNQQNWSSIARLCRASSPCVLQPAGRGIRSANDLKFLERVHEHIQRARSDPPVQSHREARAIP